MTETDVTTVETTTSDAADSPGAPAEKSRSAKTAELLVEEGDAAGDYLERLLDILDYDGDIDLDVEGERAVVSIVGGGDLEKLVGDRGAVLDALQELTRLAAAAETGVRSRLMLDIGGYRARRREELTVARPGRRPPRAGLRRGREARRDEPLRAQDRARRRGDGRRRHVLLRG